MAVLAVTKYFTLIIYVLANRMHVYEISTTLEHSLYELLFLRQRIYYTAVVITYVQCFLNFFAYVNFSNLCISSTIHGSFIVTYFTYNLSSDSCILQLLIWFLDLDILLSQLYVNIYPFLFLFVTP